MASWDALEGLRDDESAQGGVSVANSEGESRSIMHGLNDFFSGKGRKDRVYFLSLKSLAGMMPFCVW